jgi:hypothetical protein
VRLRVYMVIVAASAALAGVVGCKDDITNSGVSDVVFDLSNVRYSDVQLFLNQSCAYYPCHSAGSPQNAPNFTSYMDVMLSNVVVKKDTLGSRLYQYMVTKDPDKLMPPRDYPRPTQNQIKGIAAWILKDALAD